MNFAHKKQIRLEKSMPREPTRASRVIKGHALISKVPCFFLKRPDKSGFDEGTSGLYEGTSRFDEGTSPDEKVLCGVLKQGSVMMMIDEWGL